MKKKKHKPTHHVLFGDDITGICQGWRYASVTKIGTKWIYFHLFDGTNSLHKSKIPKWDALKKFEVDKDGKRIYGPDHNTSTQGSRRKGSKKGQEDTQEPRELVPG